MKKSKIVGIVVICMCVIICIFIIREIMEVKQNYRWFIQKTNESN